VQRDPEVAVIHLIKLDQVFQQLEQIILIHIARFMFYIVLLKHPNSSSYFQKWVAFGAARRSAEIKCTAVGFHLNSGVACCQTDLCNGVRANYQIPIMLIVGFIIILAKIQ
jgi:hypothetical protein